MISVKQILVLLCTFIYCSTYPIQKQYTRLSKSIQQHSLMSFQSEYKRKELPLTIQKQLRRLAIDEEGYLEERVKEYDEKFFRTIHAGTGILSLLGSTLTLSPLILNTLLSIDQRTMKYWHNCPWFVTIPLRFIYLIAQWCDVPLPTTDNFFSADLPALYLVCAGSGILLGYIGIALLKKALTSKASLEEELKDIRKIIQMISDSINQFEQPVVL